MTSIAYPEFALKNSELLELFLALCRVDSPSGEEKSVGDYIIKHFARHKIRTGRDRRCRRGRWSGMAHPAA